MKANEYLQSSTLYRKLIHGPHGKFSKVYAARLSDEGFGRRCTWRSLSLFRDLMDWHVGNGHDPRDLGEAHVEQYLEHRSKHWSINGGDRAAFRRLLSALRDEGLVPAAPPIEPTEHEQIVEAFAAYLTGERGLALTTVERKRQADSPVGPNTASSPAMPTTATIASTKSLSQTYRGSTAAGGTDWSIAPPLGGKTQGRQRPSTEPERDVV